MIEEIKRLSSDCSFRFLFILGTCNRVVHGVVHFTLSIDALESWNSNCFGTDLARGGCQLHI